VGACASPALGAQNAAPPKNELELDKQVATQLVAFARMAEGMKLPSRAGSTLPRPALR